MPVRNGGRYLELAVASIIAQTMREWELIAIDDGSTDATMSILQRFAAADGRITVLSGEGTGIVAALNQGIAASRSELIARMDADDIAMPERLARQIELMAARPDLLASGSTAIRIDTFGKVTGLFSVPTDAFAISHEMMRRSPFIHPTMIIRRGALMAAGGYRPGCAYAEDYDLWLRMEEAGLLANLAEPTLWFRVHKEQTSQTKRLAQRAAAALARQAAIRRRSGMSEGVDMDNSLQECCAGYLSMRADDPANIGDNETKDLTVMLRFMHLRLPRQTVSRLLQRLGGETRHEKLWVLRMRLASARIADMIMARST